MYRMYSILFITPILYPQVVCGIQLLPQSLARGDDIYINISIAIYISIQGVWETLLPKSLWYVKRRIEQVQVFTVAAVIEGVSELHG